MTNLYLQKTAPVALSTQAGEILSALVLALTAVLALVTVVTV